PMFALILHLLATPMPIGSSRLVRWTLFAGMTIRPRATSSRISSGARSSRRATNSISGVIWPLRAASICVIGDAPGEVAARRGAEGVSLPAGDDPGRCEGLLSARGTAGTPGVTGGHCRRSGAIRPRLLGLTVRPLDRFALVARALDPGRRVLVVEGRDFRLGLA